MDQLFLKFSKLLESQGNNNKDNRFILPHNINFKSFTSFMPKTINLLNEKK